MGRHTKLNSEVQKRICDALKAGNTRRISAIYGGIDEKTFYNWMNIGQNPRYTRKGEVYKDDDIFVQFFQSVTRAEADCEVWHVANVKKQASGDWRASVEWLRRRKPADWEKQDRNTARQDSDDKVKELNKRINDMEVDDEYRPPE